MGCEQRNNSFDMHDTSMSAQGLRAAFSHIVGNALTPACGSLVRNCELIDGIADMLPLLLQNSGRDNLEAFKLITQLVTEARDNNARACESAFVIQDAVCAARSGIVYQ